MLLKFACNHPRNFSGLRRLPASHFRSCQSGTVDLFGVAKMQSRSQVTSQILAAIRRIQPRISKLDHTNSSRYTNAEILAIPLATEHKECSNHGEKGEDPTWNPVRPNDTVPGTHLEAKRAVARVARAGLRVTNYEGSTIPPRVR